MTAAEPNIYARFYEEDGKRFVVIGIKGTKDEVVEFARPHHAVRFPEEWAAFERGLPEAEPAGTPLTEVPGITSEKAAGLRLLQIRTAEELAAVGDNVVAGLGLGGHAMRKAAQLLLKARRAEELEDMLERRKNRKQGKE